ncbi:MAG: M48 family metallopeptidase [Acidobacteriales bacterium]|nr:M48 family metallopeptidase [Terriglobales bacterium]
MRGNVSPRLQRIFHEQYRRIRPRAPMPEIRITFYHFANLTNTIRLREGRILVRLSDLLDGAPAPVWQAIAHILLAKLYRKEIEKGQLVRYRRHVGSRAVTEKAHQIRKIRGRKLLAAPKGHVYDLEEIFEDLNRRFFHGLMARPSLGWGRDRSRQSLGHYDPAHNAILVSRIFDDARVPRFALEYLLFHEMLHLRHPVKLRGSRRCVHSREFLAEERLFPHFEQAKAFLKRL